MCKKFYLYKITNLINEKFYYGVHETENLEDGYMGSGKALRNAYEKYGIEHFKKEILEFFENKEEMYNREKEIVTNELIENPNCYNMVPGGSGGSNDFVRGHVCVKDKNGVIMHVSINDPRYLSGELTHISKGKITVKDKNHNCLQVDENDPRYLSGELKHISKGKITVKDKDGNTFSTTVNDPRYLSGELKHIAVGRAVVKNQSGDTITVPIDSEEYQSGKYISILKNKVPVKDIQGNAYIVDINDPRYLSGELLPLSTGYAMMKDKNGETIRVKKDEITNEMKGITTGKLTVKDANDKILFISTNDSRYLSGELKHINVDKVPVVNEKGERFQITKEEYQKNKEKYHHPLKNRITVKDKYGHTMSVFKDDPRLKTGELMGVTKGMVPCCNKNDFNDKRCIHKDNPLYKTVYIPLSSIRHKKKLINN